MRANRPSISSGAWRSHADDVQPAPPSVRRTTRRRQRDREPSSGLRVSRGCRRARAAVGNCVRCLRRHRARHGKDTGVSVKCTCRRYKCQCQAYMSKIQVSVSSVYVEDTGVGVKCTCRRYRRRCQVYMSKIQASVLSVDDQLADAQASGILDGSCRVPRFLRHVMV